MQTHFSLAALTDPDTAEAEHILRACVHCGFCTATCPTYLLTGDEFDAQVALQLGFVQEIVTPGRQLDRALEIASLIARQAPLAVSAVIENARLAIGGGPRDARAADQAAFLVPATAN